MKHGVYVSEVATEIIAPSEGTSGLPVVVGTSPQGPVNEPKLVHTYKEAVEIFGYSDEWSASNSLSEFIYSQFVLYGQSPVVMIRVAAGISPLIIGGYNAETGKLTGLELIGTIYHKFGLVPGIILCPFFSHIPEVAAVMRAKADSISGIFRGICLCDIAGDKYSAIPSAKHEENFTDKRQVLCWPKVKLGDKVFHLSTQLCGVMNRTDWERDDVPYKSPSNEILQIDSCVNDSGDEVLLTLEEANYLNGQGIVTAMNWGGGWRTWGNRTAAYPAVTDPKDCFISVRRMFDFIGNTFVNEFWQKVDQPITVRLVREIVNSFNMYLNGLASREMILGGRIEFRNDENYTTALLDGKITFHLFVTPPEPAECIEGILEYDPAYKDVLVDALRS